MLTYAGLLFNESVYLASKLAALCQRGGGLRGAGQGPLCRKVWFLISTDMPGPDETLVQSLNSALIQP